MNAAACASGSSDASARAFDDDPPHLGQRLAVDRHLGPLPELQRSAAGRPLAADRAGRSSALDVQRELRRTRSLGDLVAYASTRRPRRTFVRTRAVARHAWRRVRRARARAPRSIRPPGAARPIGAIGRPIDSSGRAAARRLLRIAAVDGERHRGQHQQRGGGDARDESFAGPLWSSLYRRSLRARSSPPIAAAARRREGHVAVRRGASRGRRRSRTSPASWCGPVVGDGDDEVAQIGRQSVDPRATAASAAVGVTASRAAIAQCSRSTAVGAHRRRPGASRRRLLAAGRDQQLRADGGGAAPAAARVDRQRDVRAEADDPPPDASRCAPVDDEPPGVGALAIAARDTVRRPARACVGSAASIDEPGPVELAADRPARR